MADVTTLHAVITQRFSPLIKNAVIAINELTLEVPPEHLHELAKALRDVKELEFNMLIDVTAVDYLHYGLSEWETESATSSGFSRGVEASNFTTKKSTHQPRFATVYHLLSLTQNHRVRLHVPLEESKLMVASVVDLWPSANWPEREVFDLFGIMFTGHPDLRRILTDYGFIGHPFRKDFPLIGNVEVRYDATLSRVVYEPVSIEPRILEPKVIRDDTRYAAGEPNA
ncbi:NADH dehydrogenase [Gammaproteobacteria bacterium SCGC AG-212-F23]|nr:NADH dehydrogenase [Gammaproteobacteria bacterium SCGC AG-212-F23]